MIIDGMALVRQIRTSKMTFEEFAIKLLHHVLLVGQNSERIDVVLDVYCDSSIKGTVINRISSGSLTLQQIILTSSIKQWNLLLCSNYNKNMLIKFIVDQWKKYVTFSKEKFSSRRLVQKHIGLSQKDIVESTCWNQFKKVQTPTFYFMLKMPARTAWI